MIPVLVSGEVALTSEDVRRLPWKHLNDLPGVEVKTLWRDPEGKSYSGLMKLGPGASLPRHSHHDAVHHVWVDLGSCRIGDRTLGPGGYAYVPAGIEHGIDRAGPGGCTLLYMYLTVA